MHWIKCRPLYLKTAFRPLVLATTQSVRCLSDGHQQSANQSETQTDLKANIFSYLYVSRRFATTVYSVLRPKYSADYLQNIADNLNDIRLNLVNRGIDLCFDSNQMKENLRKLIEYNRQLEPKVAAKQRLANKIKAKRKGNKVVTEEVVKEYHDLSDETKLLADKVSDLEEIVIKFVLDLPNNTSLVHSRLTDERTPERVVDRYQPKAKSEELFKRLNYIQLSYINKCLLKSIVGPKSCYLTGIGSQLNDSLIEHFSSDLRRNQFTDISSVDVVKTAVIEATDSNDLDDFKSDPLIISAKHDVKESENLNQSLHLVGNSSFESICALISKRRFNWTSDTIKLMTIGPQYDYDLTQNNAINAMIITKDDNKLSDNQMEALYDLLWKRFTELDITCRSVICDSKNLSKSEFSRIDVQIWLSSQSRWLTALEISDYKEFVSIRLGAEESHAINAKINILPIILAIIEHNQTVEAKIIIPECLKQFI